MQHDTNSGGAAAAAAAVGAAAAVAAMIFVDGFHVKDYNSWPNISS